MNEFEAYLTHASTLSAERILKIDAEVQRLQKMHPEFLGLGFFGSTARGTAKAESDIDGIAFINIDALPIGAIKMYREASYIEPEAFFEVELSKRTTNDYVAKISKTVQNTLALSSDQVFDIWILPMSKLLIDFFIAYKKIDGGKNIPEFIYTMFFPMIGEGMEPLRSYLIQRLIELGEAGEILWQEIMSSSFSMIKGRNPVYPEPFVCPLPSAFPHTLEDAQKRYRVKNTL